ncbi:MAG TPA: hypothetical protein DCL21_07165, partial [Alphaproteobacteria bacterium]|nr:hypothetical protein [Alphaproteobacteria bacterium]
MTAACYRCGAFPNHPNPTLDVLKLIQCNDCGTVSCIKHREGIVGGQCSKCGSSRSSVIAYKSSAKKGGKETVAASSGGGSAGGAAPSGPAVTADSVSIATSQLKNMQKSRQDAEREIQERAALAAENARVAEMSAEEKEKAEKAEKAVQALLGDKNLVMAGGAEELISNIDKKLPKGVSLADIQKTIEGEKNPDKTGAINMIGVAEAANDKKGKKKKGSTLGDASAMLATAIADADISDQIKKLMDSDDFNDGAEGLEFDENSQVSHVNGQNAVAVEKVDDDDDKKDDKVDNKPEKVSKNPLTRVYQIKVLDSFSVKSSHRVHVEDVVKIKEASEKYIKDFTAKEFNIEPERIDLTLKVNNF